MKHWSLLAIELGAYTIALLATAPATLFDAILQDASDGRLRLPEASGTLWSGAGHIEIRDPDGRTGIARNLSWRIVPTSLLHGRLDYEISLEQANRHFPVTLSLSRIELANAGISLPATVLGFGVPRLAPLGLTGNVQIHVSNLSISRDGIEGNATLQWHAAASALTPVAPLGDYEVRLDGEGMTVRALLHTLEGPLRLDGKGSWTRGDNPAFTAMARVAPRHQEQLEPLLRLIAIERGTGRFELQFN